MVQPAAAEGLVWRGAPGLFGEQAQWMHQPSTDTQVDLSSADRHFKLKGLSELAFTSTGKHDSVAPAHA